MLIHCEYFYESTANDNGRASFETFKQKLCTQHLLTDIYLNVCLQNVKLFDTFESDRQFAQERCFHK